MEDLRESTERYHALVEATTEGTLLVLDGRCRYANPTFLDMLGYTPRQLEFLELADLLPREPERRHWQALDAGSGGARRPGRGTRGLPGPRTTARIVECVLALNPIVFDGQPGSILLARDSPGCTPRRATMALAAALRRPASSGRWPRAAVSSWTSTRRRADLLGGSPSRMATQPALADLFADAAEFERFLETLLADGRGPRPRAAERDAGRSTLTSRSRPRSCATSRARPLYVDGLLVDVTAARKEAAGRDALIERLQASLLFLHEPIAALAQEAVAVGLETAIGEVARRMTERHATAALVASEIGAIIGIVTDHDLRARAMAEGRAGDDPVHLVMSAPLLRIAGERARLRGPHAHGGARGPPPGGRGRRGRHRQRHRPPRPHPVPALRPHRPAARDRPRGHAGGRGTLPRARRPAGGQPHGQQRPPAPHHRHAHVRRRRHHRAAHRAGHRGARAHRRRPSPSWPWAARAAGS